MRTSRLVLPAACVLAALVGASTARIDWNGPDPTPRPVAISTSAPAPTVSPTITEDDPRWNCLTMGNHKCGPAYKPVSSALADALAEGDNGDSDWATCLIAYGDTTTIVCPDGTVLTS